MQLGWQIEHAFRGADGACIWDCSHMSVENPTEKRMDDIRVVTVTVTVYFQKLHIISFILIPV